VSLGEYVDVARGKFFAVERACGPRGRPVTAKRQALPPLLVWSRWAFYRITYDFEERRWGSLD